MNAKRVGQWLIAALLLTDVGGAVLLWQAWQERHSPGNEPLPANDRSHNASAKGQLGARQFGASRLDWTGQQARSTNPVNHP